MWYELFFVSAMFAVGNIFFGHFEELTPKWRRLLKFIIFLAILPLISYYFGREWFYIIIGILALFMIYVHAWVLPKKGINGLTGEPKEKYYKLRGWTMPSTEKKNDQF